MAERCPYNPAHTRGGRPYGGCEQRARAGGAFYVRDRPGSALTLPRRRSGKPPSGASSGRPHPHLSATLSPSPRPDGDNPVRPSGRAPADPPPRDRAPGGLDCRTAPHPPGAGEHRASVAGIIAIAGHDADFGAGVGIGDGLPSHDSGRQPRTLPHRHHSATTRPPGTQPRPAPIQVTG